MKSRKSLVILVGALIIGIIGYFVLCPIICPKPKNNYTIIAFENELNKDQLKSLVDQIKEINKNSTEEIKFKLILKSGSEIKFSHIQSGEFDFEEKFYNPQLLDTLNVLFKSNRSKVLTNDDANTQIQSMIQAYNDRDESDDIDNIILIGNFPKCYSQQDLSQALKSLSNIKANNPKKTIIWNLNSNTNEPEQKILAYLKSKVNLIDKQISVNKRICPNTDKKIVYAILFDKFDRGKSQELINYLGSSIPGQILFKIWNNPQNANLAFEINNKSNLPEAFLKSFETLNKIQWGQLGSSLNQFVSNISIMPDTSIKFVVIIGNLPKEGIGSQIDKTFWDKLKSINKLKVLFYIPSGLQMNETDKAFLDGLKIFKINYVIN